MFERFNEPARRVVIYAQDEARDLRHNYVGSEHLLLGLMYEQDQIADRFLRSVGLTLDLIRDHVVRIVEAGEEVTSGQIPFTPRATKVLELSVREALQLGHNIIGTEHVLLGLLHGNEGVGIRVLLEHGLDPEQLCASVLELVAGPDPDPPPQPSARSIPDERAHPQVLRRWMRVTATPSETVQRVVMQAGARAVGDGRTEFTVIDLVSALKSDEQAARELGAPAARSPERDLVNDETDAAEEA